MSKKGYTQLTVILDGSYSFSNLQNGIIRGFNSLISAQKDRRDEMTLTLLVFNTLIELHADLQELAKTKPLSKSNYIPRNQSCLLDAIGQGIVETQESIKMRHEQEKPESVIFLIVSDGKDTCSSKYEMKMLRSSIKSKIKDGWEFLFISPVQGISRGVNKIGLSKDSSLSFTPNEPGTLLAFQSVNRLISDYRDIKIENCHFQPEDINRQENLVQRIGSK